ncbi:MAG: ATP-binding protein [Chloroflexi bacterium]|nr:ATP-binding protein [Chloroflexota bacterium]
MDYNQLAADAERLAKSLGQFPEPVVHPALVAVSGLPGSGKSYFSRRLAERLPFVILESDTLRKVLFPSPSYDLKENSYLFRVIHHLIEKLLNKGISLILDATNLSERHREYLYHIADRLEVRLILVRIAAPPEVVRGRLEKRLKNQESKSDADWTVYQKMKSSVERIRRKHYVVDTSQDINPVLNKIVKEVAR